MNINTLRAAAAAFFLATAAVAVAATLSIAPAQAAARPTVGKPLQDAIHAASAGNFGAARAAVAQAEAVSNLTAGDRAAIDQVKQYIAAKSSGGSGCAALYLKGDYRGVIASGGGDGQCSQLKAQAYYLLHDYAGCSRFIRNNFGSGAGEATLTLQLRCAYEAGDDQAQRAALEELVGRTGKPEYWKSLLNIAERARGLADHQTLDIYRLKLLTGSMKGADDYSLLAQLALQIGFPAEAQTVEQKGFAANLLSGDRANRLANMTKNQVDAQAANMAKTTAAANAARNGDALVKLGETLWGMAKYPDAIATVKAGIAKGPTDANEAQLRLGMAYLGAGQKEAAQHAFAQVKGNSNQVMIAHLWSLYARR